MLVEKINKQEAYCYTVLTTFGSLSITTGNVTCPITPI